MTMAPYSSLYCSTTTPLFGILDCLPSGNPVLLTPSVQSEVSIEQITGGMYVYAQANKPLISMDNIDQDTAADLQKS